MTAPKRPVGRPRTPRVTACIRISEEARAYYLKEAARRSGPYPARSVGHAEVMREVLEREAARYGPSSGG